MKHPFGDGSDGSGRLGAADGLRVGGSETAGGRPRKLRLGTADGVGVGGSETAGRRPRKLRKFDANRE